MTHRSLFIPLLCAVFAALLVSPIPAEAQVWKKVKKKAKQTVERKAEEKTEDAVESAIDGAIECVIGDDRCVEAAQEEGKTVVMTDADGEVIRDEGGTPLTAAEMETSTASIGDANANYDFEPGERTLFADDFTTDNVGDFPRNLHYLSGGAEVVDAQGRRLMRFTSKGVFQVRLDETLPETFTLEFDAQVAGAADVSIYFAAPVYDKDTTPFWGYEGDYLNVGNWRGSGLWTGSGPKAVKPYPKDQVLPVRVQVDEGYVKMYAGTDRIANVPRADLGRHDAITFSVNARTDRVAYLGSLRVAAGGKDLYSALESEGRVAVQDILFDTGKATIKSTSAETLAKIGALLTEHTDLRLLVEGHTDNEGDFAANMTLSTARAEAVRAYLLERHGIDPARLTTMGLGQTRPVAPNETEAGRAENRRVELVRM
jgi:outer membrane protein OmpA-like peptidoglycan-associated protein